MSSIAYTDIASQILAGRYNINDLSGDFKNHIPLFIVLINNNPDYYDKGGPVVQKSDSVFLVAVEQDASKLAGSEFANDRDFMRKAIHVNPEAIQYIGSELKKDVIFMAEMSAKYDSIEKGILEEQGLSQDMKDSITRNAELIKKIQQGDFSLLMENEQLANNKTFMEAAIEVNARALSYAGGSLKNDKEFIHEQAMRSDNVIEVIIEDTQKEDISERKFGRNALEATGDALRDKLIIESYEEYQRRVMELKNKKEASPETFNEKDQNALNIYERHLKFVQRMEEDKQKGDRFAKRYGKIVKNGKEELKKRSLDFNDISDAMDQYAKNEYSQKEKEVKPTGDILIPNDDYEI